MNEPIDAAIRAAGRIEHTSSKRWVAIKIMEEFAPALKALESILICVEAEDVSNENIILAVKGYTRDALKQLGVPLEEDE